MDEKNTSKKGFKEYAKDFLDYLIKTLNGMAYGLFATLIVGTIINQVGDLFLEVAPSFASIVKGIATGVKVCMGAGIGVGVALSLKLDNLKVIVAGSVGLLVAYLQKLDKFITSPADPLTIYVSVALTLFLLSLIFVKKTPVDIILIPLVGIIVASAFYLLLGKYIVYVTTGVGEFINTATNYQPFIMGILVAVTMGLALTAPISSAAIAISFGITGLAGGAAVVGCCVQMLGFAVMSRKDNSIGTVISIAIGTSMLQFKNILKKPIIWLPTIIVSAILGPLSTMVFKATCNPAGAGMGTSGLVGLFQTFDSMGNTPAFWYSLIVLEIVLPIILVFIIDVIFRKFKLIKEGDLTV